VTNPPPRIAVVAAETEAAQQALDELRDFYPCVPPEHAEIIIPLEGTASPAGKSMAGAHRPGEFA